MTACASSRHPGGGSFHERWLVEELGPASVLLARSTREGTGSGPSAPDGSTGHGDGAPGVGQAGRGGPALGGEAPALGGEAPAAAGPGAPGAPSGPTGPTTPWGAPAVPEPAPAAAGPGAAVAPAGPTAPTAAWAGLVPGGVASAALAPPVLPAALPALPPPGVGGLDSLDPAAGARVPGSERSLTEHFGPPAGPPEAASTEVHGKDQGRSVAADTDIVTALVENQAAGHDVMGRSKGADAECNPQKRQKTM